DCLRRFGERLRPLRATSVRAVGTNTLRLARNRRELMESAQEALGYPIDVISGTEEARLTYSGVRHAMMNAATRCLVVDVGGGSTECVLGEDGQVLAVNSLFMGCVSHTMRHFPDGKLST